ncbi:hypothetical protein [Streptomyces collinus]|uniref:hypothetical protein n=1 Tax=Streptomyces collinus TaxID=42684 RepID=UPI0029426328|nr:hypothetical protein [Streptomyces collinus]
MIRSPEVHCAPPASGAREDIEEIRRIRNNVMHFNSSDPLPRTDVDKIRHLNKLLREYGE